MAMSGTAMATAVRNAIATVMAGNPDPTTVHNDVWDAICNAIVAHIQDNARVLNTGADGPAHTHAPAYIDKVPTP